MFNIRRRKSKKKILNESIELLHKNMAKHIHDCTSTKNKSKDCYHCKYDYKCGDNIEITLIWIKTIYKHNFGDYAACLDAYNEDNNNVQYKKT